MGISRGWFESGMGVEMVRRGGGSGYEGRGGGEGLGYSSVEVIVLVKMHSMMLKWFYIPSTPCYTSPVISLNLL